MATAPPRPFVAAPDPSQNWPLLPLEELPELKISEPDAPLAPEFDVRNSTDTLLEKVPSPPDRFSTPPVLIVLRPA